MGSVLKNRQADLDVPPSKPDVSRSCNDPTTPEMPLFRFRLRHLFGLMTVVCGLFAVATLANVLTTIVVIMTAVLVAAHVCSTFLGFSLRAHADAIRENSQTDTPASVVPAPEMPALTRDVCVPRRPNDSAFYSYDQSTRWIPALPLAGMAVGGTVGGIVLRVSLGQQISFGGVAVGALSLAVVGGWCVFIAANFFGIARSLWKQAMLDQRKREIGSMAK